MRMYASKDKMAVFMERGHSSQSASWSYLSCIPLDSEMAADIPMFFQSALNESAGDWSANKKIIDISRGGTRRNLPKGLPYFAVEWAGGGYPGGGVAQIIEDRASFSNSFGEDVVLGMLGRDSAAFGRAKARLSHSQALKAAADFKREWSAYNPI